MRSNEESETYQAAWERIRQILTERCLVCGGGFDGVKACGKEECLLHERRKSLVNSYMPKGPLGVPMVGVIGEPVTREADLFLEGKGEAPELGPEYRTAIVQAIDESLKGFMMLTKCLMAPSEEERALARDKLSLFTAPLYWAQQGAAVLAEEMAGK